MIDILDDLDRWATEPAVIYGSLPPDARDIDVVTSPAHVGHLGTALSEAGFVRRGDRYAYFDGNDGVVVDLRPASAMGLGPDAAGRLLADAVPIGEREHLRRPAPHHAILLLALRAGREGRLDDRRRERLEEAEAEDPCAWEKARSEAGVWGAGDDLEFLREARVGATRPRRDGIGRRVRRAVASRRGAIIALSGLDGAGKSAQAERLKASLAAVGIDATTSWTRLSHDAALATLAWVVRDPAAQVRRVRRGALPGGPSRDSDDGGSTARSAPRPVSTGAWKRSAVSRAVWPLLVAALNARSHLRVLRHVASGRVVICDRFALDSLVQLRHKYAAGTTLPVAATLVRLLSPSPVAAFLLDVPAEVAYARKRDDFDLDELAAQADLYREIAPSLGVTIVDGTAPIATVTARLATQVWLRLP